MCKCFSLSLRLAQNAPGAGLSARDNLCRDNCRPQWKLYCGPPRARSGVRGKRPHPGCPPPRVVALYECLARPWPWVFSHEMKMLSPTFSNGPLAPRVCGLKTSSILKWNIIDYILIV